MHISPPFCEWYETPCSKRRWYREAKWEMAGFFALLETNASVKGLRMRAARGKC